MRAQREAIVAGTANTELLAPRTYTITWMRLLARSSPLRTLAPGATRC